MNQDTKATTTCGGEHDLPPHISIPPSLSSIRSHLPGLTSCRHLLSRIYSGHICCSRHILTRDSSKTAMDPWCSLPVGTPCFRYCPVLNSSPSSLLHLLWPDLVPRDILIRHSFKTTWSLITCQAAYVLATAAGPLPHTPSFSSSLLHTLLWCTTFGPCARHRSCWISRSLLLPTLLHPPWLLPHSVL